MSVTAASDGIKDITTPLSDKDIESLKAGNKLAEATTPRSWLFCYWLLLRLSFFRFLQILLILLSIHEFGFPNLIPGIMIHVLPSF